MLEIVLHVDQQKQHGVCAKRCIDCHTPRMAAAPTTVPTPIAKAVFKRPTDREHVLLRPDAYLGDVTMQDKENCWVFNEATKMMECKTLRINPGFLKTFDELLVNAADARQRGRGGTDIIKIEVMPEKCQYSVWNNGTFPLEVHAAEKCWTPELLWGRLRSGENFNDEEKRVVGGRNGFGAKLTNIFADEFMVEIGSSATKQIYRQRWTTNMSICHSPTSTTKANAKDYVMITVTVDAKRFAMPTDKFDADTMAAMHKRVLDIAGNSFAQDSADSKVYWNGKKVTHCCNFKQYVGLFWGPDRGADKGLPRVFLSLPNNHWHIAISRSAGKFQQLSMVNSVVTARGGKHVQAIVTQIVKHVNATVFKEGPHAKLEIKPGHIRNQLAIIMNCLIVNPAFDSQTKEFLTTNKSDFGSSCDLPPDFLDAVVKKTGIVDQIVRWAERKQVQQLKDTDGKKRVRLTGLQKLTDANLAGTKRGSECTIILTEGDSAEALVQSALQTLGRDLFGVYPLRGKILNVREAKPAQISKNPEITAIKKILGLQQDVVYKDTKDLRYGHVMVMTDQDHDGSHIKGLIINLFQTFWPSLYKMPGFLQEFITPIVQCQRPGLSMPVPFYTIPEFKAWQQTPEGLQHKWRVKYHKGLGTSTAADGQRYFSNLARHRIDFQHVDVADDEAMALAFQKNKAAQRKEWLKTATTDTFLDMNVRQIRYLDFVNKELILFSIAAVQRAIPSVLDGQKPGQRKILYAAFKRNLRHDIKLVQFAGYVSEHAAYHHGESALQDTIVKMAQNYVGSNNIHLFQPVGQFGTRAAGGEDSASARYIFTALEPITRCIFPGQDDVLLKYKEDDGQRVEPETYVPVVPMVLINGAAGIGVGWATNIPCYNPGQIISHIKQLLLLPADSPPEKPVLSSLIPFYRGFRGKIEADGRHSLGVVAEVEMKGNKERLFDITELPIGMWTQKYKLFLEDLLTKDHISDFKEYHTDRYVHFHVTVPLTSPLKLATPDECLISFNLRGDIATNLVCFNSTGTLQKYSSPLEILEEHYRVRLHYYELRKQHLVQQLEAEMRKAQNQARFIDEVIRDIIVLKRIKTVIATAMLADRGYERIFMQRNHKPTATQTVTTAVVPGDDSKMEDEEIKESEMVTDEGSEHGYEYLLNMQMASQTQERIEKLQAEVAKKDAQLVQLNATTPKQMWLQDLEKLEIKLEQHDKSVFQQHNVSAAVGETTGKKGAKSKRKAPGTGSRKQTQAAKKHK